jgi:hypothetical protein
MTEQEWLNSNDPTSILEHAMTGRKCDNSLYCPSDRKLRLFACACVRQIQHLLPDKRNRDLIEVSELYADGLSSDEVLETAWRATNEYELSERPYARLTHWLVPMMGNSLYQSVVQLLVDLRIIAGVDYRLIQANLLRDIIGNPFRLVTLPDSPKICCLRCDGRQGRWARDGIDATWKDCSVCKGTGEVSGPCPWLTPTVITLASAAYDLRERQCGRCDSGWLPKHGAPDPGMMSRCSSCHGTGRIKDGTLDSLRLELLADALEEAGCVGDRVWLCNNQGTHQHEGRAGEVIHGLLHETNPRFYHHHHDMHCEYQDLPHPILAHLRSPGPHVRGCWAVDVVLGNS